MCFGRRAKSWVSAEFIVVKTEVNPNWTRVVGHSPSTLYIHMEGQSPVAGDIKMADVMTWSEDDLLYSHLITEAL